MSNTNNDWTAEDEDEDADQEYLYNEDPEEDEFGLPSVMSMRREARRIQTKKINDPGGGRSTGSNSLSNFSAESLTGKGIADSSDIAEERGPPSYPTAKQSEGKILRPQYKDILRGLFFHRCLEINAEVFLRQILRIRSTLSAIPHCR